MSPGTRGGKETGGTRGEAGEGRTSRRGRAARRVHGVVGGNRSATNLAVAKFGTGARWSTRGSGHEIGAWTARRRWRWTDEPPRRAVGCAAATLRSSRACGSRGVGGAGRPAHRGLDGARRSAAARWVLTGGCRRCCRWVTQALVRVGPAVTWLDVDVCALDERSLRRTDRARGVGLALAARLCRCDDTRGRGGLAWAWRATG